MDFTGFNKLARTSVPRVASMMARWEFSADPLLFFFLKNLALAHPNKHKEWLEGRCRWRLAWQEITEREAIRLPTKKSADTKQVWIDSENAVRACVKRLIVKLKQGARRDIDALFRRGACYAGNKLVSGESRPHQARMGKDPRKVLLTVRQKSNGATDLLLAGPAAQRWLDSDPILKGCTPLFGVHVARLKNSQWPPKGYLMPSDGMGLSLLTTDLLDASSEYILSERLWEVRISFYGTWHFHHLNRWWRLVD